MKKITENTILKQGEKEFKAVQFADNICWYSVDQIKPIAQSEPILQGVPWVFIGRYAKRLAETFYPSGVFDRAAFLEGYEQNPNKYTEADVRRATVLARKGLKDIGDGIVGCDVSVLLYTTEILNQINQIQSITVDEDFNILSYE